MRFEQSYTGCVRLCKNRAGNVSTLFALVAVPVIGCIGLAIDYGMAARVQSQMQVIVDHATLAAISRSTNGSELTATAERLLSTDFERYGLSPIVSVTSDPTRGTVTVSAETTRETLFMGLLGSQRTKIRVISTAIAGAGGPIDVAIAFDTTGSMAGAKLSGAQQAASDLVDLLFKVPGSNTPNPDAAGLSGLRTINRDSEI